MAFASLEEAFRRQPIASLVHFTPLENLSGILIHGLLSRHQLVARRLHHRPPDQLRFDRCPDYISFSLNRPNRLLLHRLIERYAEQPFVIIRVRASILWATAPLFFPDNAACAHFRNVPLEEFSGPTALLRFLEANQGRYGDPDEALSQREILVPRHVPCTSFEEVIFRHGQDTRPFEPAIEKLGIPIKRSTLSFTSLRGGVI